MMRELKFRAYGKNLKKMVYFSDLYWFEENNVHDSSGDAFGETYSIMQYTSLKDKNGKEIYEGDILKYYTEKLEIVFRIGAFGYKYFGDFRWLVNFNKTEMEVIGNIHENPELLEKEGNA